MVAVQLEQISSKSSLVDSVYVFMLIAQQIKTGQQHKVDR